MTWPKIPLSDAFWFQEGPGLRNWQFTSEGIKILNVGNIMSDGSIDLSRTDRHLSIEEFKSKYSHFGVDSGDLVIASSGISFDEDGFLRTKVGFIEPEHLPLCMNTSTIRFKSKEQKSYLPFLKHWFQSSEFRQQISQLVTGSAQLNFGPSHLKSMSISLPPLDKQRRIAEILDQADALRRLRARALDKLNTLGQAIFHEMFGGVDIQTQSLEKLSDLKRGPFGGALKKDIFVSAGYQVYEQSHAISKDAFHGRYFITEHKFHEMKAFAVKPQDLIVSCSGTLGKVLRVPENTPKGIINQALLRIRPRQQFVRPAFLEAFLETSYTKNLLSGFSRGTGLQNFPPMADVKQILVPTPSLELQDQFIDRLNQIETSAKSLRQSDKSFAAMFTSLQHRAFRGEL